MFLQDVWKVDEACVCVSVSGRYAEAKELRSFYRTCILAPPPPGSDSADAGVGV